MNDLGIRAFLNESVLCFVDVFIRNQSWSDIRSDVRSKTDKQVEAYSVRRRLFFKP